jgi:hypothetical protein
MVMGIKENRMKDKHIDIGNCIESLEAAQEMYNNAANIETLTTAIYIMDVCVRKITTAIIDDGNMEILLTIMETSIKEKSV